MDPTGLGVIGPGFLTQVPTLGSGFFSFKMFSVFWDVRGASGPRPVLVRCRYGVQQKL